MQEFKSYLISQWCVFVICFLSVQSQVDEVIDVMQENISKVIERGERLDDLQDKSGESLCHSTCVLYVGGGVPHAQDICDSSSVSLLFMLTFILQFPLSDPKSIRHYQGNALMGPKLSAMCFQFTRQTFDN